MTLVHRVEFPHIVTSDEIGTEAGLYSECCVLLNVALVFVVSPFGVNTLEQCLDLDESMAHTSVGKASCETAIDTLDVDRKVMLSELKNGVCVHTRIRINLQKAFNYLLQACVSHQS